MDEATKDMVAKSTPTAEQEAETMTVITVDEAEAETRGIITNEMGDVPTEIVVRNVRTDLMDSLADLKAYDAFRTKLDKFIKSKFKKGVHYGPPFEGADKDAILLPGAQAIARLTQTKPMFFPDMELFEQMGRTPGVIVMKCYLVPMSQIPFIAEQVVQCGVDVFEPLCKMFCLAEGRGGGYIAEKKNKLKENMVVKMVQTRALRDAAVRVADLSAEYDQDTDEYSKEELGFFDKVGKGTKNTPKETKETKDDDILGEDILSDNNLDECPLPKDAATNPLANEDKDDEVSDGEL